MKVFATLAAILGFAYATPNAQIHHLGRMGSMRSALQQQGNVMPSMKMAAPLAETSPNQYHLQDDLGNYEYAFKNQDSEKMEKGNDRSVRGRYAYIMSDGVLRRVDYIADNSGFHILQDNADNSRAQDRIKRSAEPDLIQTRMISFMDSPSLRSDSLTMANPNIYVLGQGLSKNRMNEISSNHNVYGMADTSNKMGVGMLGDRMMGNVMGHNMINENVMGRNIGHNMYTNGNSNMMNQDMLNRKIMGQDMSSNMMGRDMYSPLMASDMSSSMMNQNMLGRDLLKSKMIGQEMSSNMMGQKMSRNMMDRMRNTYSRDISRLPLGQRKTMRQTMKIEQIPQSVASNLLQ